MCGVFVVGDVVEKCLSQYIVLMVDIDGDGDGGGFLFDFVVRKVGGGTGQPFVDGFQFVGIILHEKPGNHRNLFEYKINDVGSDENVHHGKHVLVSGFLTLSSSLMVHRIDHQHGHHIGFERFHHIVGGRSHLCAIGYHLGYLRHF